MAVATLQNALPVEAIQTLELQEIHETQELRLETQTQDRLGLLGLHVATQIRDQLAQQELHVLISIRDQELIADHSAVLQDHLEAQ